MDISIYMCVCVCVCVCVYFINTFTYINRYLAVCTDEQVYWLLVTEWWSIHWDSTTNTPDHQKQIYCICCCSWQEMGVARPIRCRSLPMTRLQKHSFFSSKLGKRSQFGRGPPNTPVSLSFYWLWNFQSILSDVSSSSATPGQRSGWREMITRKNYRNR